MAGISGNKSSNKTRGQSTFGQEVWQPGGNALQNLYSQVGGLFNQTSPGTAYRANEAGQFGQDVMQNQVPAYQQQLQGGAYGGLGVGDQLMSSLQQSQNQPSATQRINNQIMGGEGNNYADAMRNQYVSDATRAQENMLANTDARAAAAGMSGGARQGVLQARGMRDINENLQRNMANVGYSSFEKDLDRKLGIAEQADQNTLGRQQLMSGMLGNQQQAMRGGFDVGNQMFNQAQTQQALPWQQAGTYSDIIGDPTLLGSGASNQMGKGSGFGVGASAGKK